jgi:ATP-dependent DNA ligase
VVQKGSPKKEDYIAALRQYHLERNHPDQPLSPQIMPMLLGDWNDLELGQAESIERDDSAWILQPKRDGVRALMHIDSTGVRITSRCISEVTYRLSEFQENLHHLMNGLSHLTGTILDGELVCPLSEVDTGKSISSHPLQATTAILSTSPENAREIQEQQLAHLRFHVFDILAFCGTPLTALPLYERQGFLEKAIKLSNNPYLESVPSFVIGKTEVHRRIIGMGGEGTVWKRADQPYKPGRRVKHWLKRKQAAEVEGFVTGFKPGTPNNGHAHLVGALEFSVRDSNETTRPIAWVSNWTDNERQAMTHHGPNGEVRLNPTYLGRRALIIGQDYSAKSNRLRHARLKRWRQTD